MDTIAYKKGFKYQLARDYVVDTDVIPSGNISTEYIDLSMAGTLTIKKGYAWDGPSGPTIDTSNFMRASLVHDALYQLMRENRISRSYREKADGLLKQMCIDDGMSRLRAWYVHFAVDRAAKRNARPSKRRSTLYAP